MALAERESLRARAEGLRERPAAGVLVALLPFLALTLLWLALDSRVPDFDSGRSIANAINMHAALGRGDLLAPITADNLNHYPPLLYVVASLGMAIGGVTIDAARLSHVLFFMPLLALGTWGTARRAWGSNGAGALAAVFALGTPMVVSAFHMFILDVAQASLIAVCVWLVLESRRFSRIGISALAGLAGGGAMLLKPTTVLFLIGLFAVVLLRGGWRHWLGVLAFLAVGAVISAPWYLEHYHQLLALTSGAAHDSTGGGASPYLVPPRYSAKNALWYGWDLLNVQLLAPLFVAFAAGLVTAVVRFARTRAADDPTPELLAGGLVGWLGITYIALKDPRYTLPALIYVAVFGVAWVPALRPRPRHIAAAALVLVAAVNAIGISFGIGQLHRLSFTHQAPTPLGERTIRLYTPTGYIVGKPRDDSDVLRVMRAVKADGIDTMELDPGGDSTFSLPGLQVLLRQAGLTQPPVYRANALGPRTAFLMRRPVPPGGPRPCGRVADGQGLYLILGGNAVVPFADLKFYCPPR